MMNGTFLKQHIAQIVSLMLGIIIVGLIIFGISGHGRRSAYDDLKVVDVSGHHFEIKGQFTATLNKQQLNLKRQTITYTLTVNAQQASKLRPQNWFLIDTANSEIDQFYKIRVNRQPEIALKNGNNRVELTAEINGMTPKNLKLVYAAYLPTKRRYEKYELY